MKFSEKLARLTDGKNKQKVGQAAGLAITTISDYIAKKSSPKADKALVLARELKVPLEWLVDDAKEWPPPDLDAKNPPIADLPTNDLIFEIARRYCLDLLDAFRFTADAEAIDWSGFSQQIKRTKNDGSPKRFEAQIQILRGLLNNVSGILARYDIRTTAILLHHRLPGKEKNVEAFNHIALTERLIKLREKDGFDDAVNWAIKAPGVERIWDDRMFGIRDILDLLTRDRKPKKTHSA